ncbi:pseudouridine synthase [Novosphingobium sp. AP12]|uniref:pseudouridine synthase n=1 Tax=Novosphingobium sp. AP12 TaxID=1144305 RepID=UPI000271DD08|nr:pseudouridine synthase [Novosphingobium sp. AP12]EJL34661.1 pseudouridine synthase family protein [Novosphingobium sp. AP12]
MSKPPSKSGGSGRGRPPHGSSGGGSSRDRSSFGSSPRGGSRDGGAREGSPRGDAPRSGRGREETPGGGAPRYNSGGSRSGGGRDDGPRSGGGSRGGYSRDAAPRDGGYRGSRDGAPRGDAPRSGAPRDGGYRGGAGREDSPRGGQRGGYSRDGGPRGDSPRGSAPRDGASPRPPRRDDAPRDAAPREAYRGGTPRGAYSRDDAPRGASRDGAPRATYSRGPRDDRRDERSGGGRFGRGDAPRPPRPIANPGPAPRAAKPTPKNPLLPARDGERIAKLLARAGVASRREVERLIAEGRVRIGDQIVEAPSTVLTSLAGVTVDGNLIAEPEHTRLFLFHKPAGLITAERDPAGRPTIYSALRNALPEGSGRVMPIGRLDLNTEGLLLLTNDGEFKRQLELPSTGVPRTYRARTFGDITQSRLEELMEGIEVDGVIYGKINANMERRTGRNQWIEMTLTEGKNREVRRVLEALDLQVSRLLRVAYGPFVLGDMPKGTAGEVSQKDLENFRRTLKESAAREANARADKPAAPEANEPEAEEPEA